MKKLVPSLFLFTAIALSPLVSNADPTTIDSVTFTGSFTNIAAASYNPAGDLRIEGPDGTLVKTYRASQVTDNVLFYLISDTRDKTSTIPMEFESGLRNFLLEDFISTFYYQAAGPSGSNFQDVEQLKIIGNGLNPNAGAIQESGAITLILSSLVILLIFLAVCSKGRRRRRH